MKWAKIYPYIQFLGGRSPGAVSYWARFYISQILTASIFGHKAGRR